MSVLDVSGRLARIRAWDFLARRANYDSKRLCELCRVSLRTIERYFRVTGSPPPRKWLNEIRLKAALASMAEGSKSVKEVAIDCGYKQRTHFCRVFKEAYGVGPSKISERRLSKRIAI